MIGLLCANSHGAGASVAPWGGIAGRLATNPLAGGWPDGEGGALVLDITTKRRSRGQGAGQAQSRRAGARGLDHRRGWPAINRSRGLLRRAAWQPLAFWRRHGAQGLRTRGRGRAVGRGAERGGLCAGPAGADRQRLLLTSHRHWTLSAARRVRGSSAGVRRLSAGLAQSRGLRCHPAAGRAGKSRSDNDAKMA